MEVYKINDVIQCDFLKIPKSMFVGEKYRRLSSDAKLAYALLYDRLSLSKLNGWINENDEVYLIYTREELAEDLGLTYKKAIGAFKELLGAELITEQRRGQGAPNRIYIVKPELSQEQAKAYTGRENLRTAESAYQEIPQELERNPEIHTDGEVQAPVGETPAFSELPNGNIQNCQNGISRPADSAHQDLPKSQSNQTYINQTKENHTEYSPSVCQGNVFPFYLPEPDRQTDSIYSLDDILEQCELDTFDEEERKILYDAIERLFYSKTFRIGNVELPRDKVRSRLYELDATVLRSALANLHRNDRQVKNVTGYVMSTIFNCITEDYSMIHTDPYLNALRKQGKGDPRCI